MPTQHEFSLHRIVPDQISDVITSEQGPGRDGSRRAIDYVPENNRYSDRVEEEGHDDAEQMDPTRAIEEGNLRLNSALPGHLQQDQQPGVENEWARS